MTRARTKHELIPKNESKRNETFEKKTDGLVKKANELSNLCGVEVAIIIHKQRHHRYDLGEDNAMLWPSPPIFRDRLHKFLDFSDFEKRRRMVKHEKFMEQITKKERENVSKWERRWELQESRQLMNELMKQDHMDDYFDELELYQLNGLNSLVENMLTKLETTSLNALENSRHDEWFVGAMPEDPPPPPSEAGGAATSSVGSVNMPNL
ncbi:hypothetical protein ABFX02_12G070300 [Erythranthe guttata]